MIADEFGLPPFAQRGDGMNDGQERTALIRSARSKARGRTAPLSWSLRRHLATGERMHLKGIVGSVASGAAGRWFTYHNAADPVDGNACR